MILDKSEGKCKVVAHLSRKAIGEKQKCVSEIKTELQCGKDRACKTGNAVSETENINQKAKKIKWNQEYYQKNQKHVLKTCKEDPTDVQLE